MELAQYALQSPLCAIVQTDPSRHDRGHSLAILPAGALLRFEARPLVETGLVDAWWDDQLVRVFWQDVQQRAVELADFAGVA